MSAVPRVIQKGHKTKGAHALTILSRTAGTRFEAVRAAVGESRVKPSFSIGSVGSIT